MDKTRYIEQLENEPAPYIFFLRPRRFGKTLFVSMLRYYYGLEHQEQFDSLFGKYYIGAHPTSRAHSYHVLKFDFSRIGTSTPETTQSGFQQNVLIGVKNFEKRYDGISQDYTGYENPSDALKEFFVTHREKKIYLLIDEYDHFAYEISSFHFEHFSESAQLETTVQAATVQLQGYLQSEALQRLDNLKAYAIVFVGPEVRAVEAVA